MNQQTEERSHAVIYAETVLGTLKMKNPKTKVTVEDIIHILVIQEELASKEAEVTRIVFPSELKAKDFKSGKVPKDLPIVLTGLSEELDQAFVDLRNKSESASHTVLYWLAQNLMYSTIKTKVFVNSIHERHLEDVIKSYDNLPEDIKVNLIELGNIALNFDSKTNLNTFTEDLTLRINNINNSLQVKHD